MDKKALSERELEEIAATFWNSDDDLEQSESEKDECEDLMLVNSLCGDSDDLDMNNLPVQFDAGFVLVSENKNSAISLQPGTSTDTNIVHHEAIPQTDLPGESQHATETLILKSKNSTYKFNLACEVASSNSNNPEDVGESLSDPSISGHSHLSSNSKIVSEDAASSLDSQTTLDVAASSSTCDLSINENASCNEISDTNIEDIETGRQLNISFFCDKDRKQNKRKQQNLHSSNDAKLYDKIIEWMQKLNNEQLLQKINNFKPTVLSGFVVFLETTIESDENMSQHLENYNDRSIMEIDYIPDVSNDPKIDSIGNDDHKNSAKRSLKRKSSDTVEQKLSLVDNAVWGFMSIGSGHFNMNEVFSILGIKSIDEKSFQKFEEKLRGYLAFGCRIVWQFYKWNRQTHSKRNDGSVTDYVIVVGVNALNDSGDTYEVASTQLHPLFDSDHFNYAALLLNTTTSIIFSYKVQPIVLTPLIPFDGSNVIITGWGINNSSATYDNYKLQTLNTTVISRSECQKIYTGVNWNVSAPFMCTFMDQNGPCFTDVGAPVTACNMQFAIVFYPYCGIQPDVLVTVFAIYDWIISMI
ncbi:hypothetical protein RN001_011733 [Aquatica leii]|uniref:Peptidase S1 domain-containing protein n=1 Tax=Aquatica leii TaxID=1421715 RepID=A0AAN7S7I6_9COLE|nr:hypothetical protein RN001_011733 [Aquatica leii]